MPYEGYWQRKKALADNAPVFPLRRWWPSQGLSDIEQLYFDALAQADSVLDYGAGDLAMRQKFISAGFLGRYDTFDIGSEFEYTIGCMDDLRDNYDGILCLDVLEHMPLEDGLRLIRKLAGLLAIGGVLVIQTPNARCIRNPMAWDMTHVHCYSARDLWAYLASLNLRVQGFRVVFDRGRFTRWSPFRTLSRYFVSRVCEADFADNVALVARRDTI